MNSADLPFSCARLASQNGKNAAWNGRFHGFGKPSGVVKADVFDCSDKTF